MLTSNGSRHMRSRRSQFRSALRCRFRIWLAVTLALFFFIVTTLLERRGAMESDAHRLTEAERQLKLARRILTHPTNYDPDEWMLLATLVEEADLMIQADGQVSAVFGPCFNKW